MNKQKIVVPLSDGDDEIKITNEQSSLAEFTKRSLPTDKEVEDFEEYVEGETKDEDIDESLNEIYQDDRGNMVDVKKMDIKKRRGLLFRIFQFLLVLVGLSALVYVGYYYFYLKPGNDVTAVEFKIEGQGEVVSGQEFFYTITYKNLSNVKIADAKINLVYPENFIFLESSLPNSSDKNTNWVIPALEPKNSGQIKIKGKIIGQQSEMNIVLGDLTYKPDNISSEFKKESSYTTTVKDVGLDFDFDFAPNALIKEENDIILRLNAKANNFIDNFRLTFEPQENIEFLSVPIEKNVGTSSFFELTRPGVWQIKTVDNEIKSLPIKFSFTKKKNNSQEIIFNFEQEYNGKFYKFFQQKLAYEVMKNDLNLILIANGSRDDQGIAGGQNLNYSLTYANKGDAAIKDVVIMAILEGSLVDWDSLKSDPAGRFKSNNISWTKEEIGTLAEINPGQEGTIDFSIKVKNLNNFEADNDYQIKSYANFSIGSGVSKASEENRSNVIVMTLNSNLNLEEKIRYFNEDNIPVGTGPQPPKIGQTTSYKIYWVLTNSLHELTDVRVSLLLPAYVTWNDKANFSAGDLQYNSDTREVVWQIGRLPSSVLQAKGEFSISITPGEDDYNKIMVLSPGAKASATDSATNAILEQTAKADTTKLENDPIGTSDGIVGR